MKISEKIKLYLVLHGDTYGCELDNKVFIHWDGWWPRTIKLNSCSSRVARRMANAYPAQIKKYYVRKNGQDLVVYYL